MGNRACLRCSIYKDIQLQSVKRRTVKYDVFPDTILETFPNPETDRDRLSELFSGLSDFSALVLAARYICGLSANETAKALHISQSSVYRIIKSSVRQIKKGA